MRLPGFSSNHPNEGKYLPGGGRPLTLPGMGPADPLDAASLERALRGSWGRRLRLLAVVGSTNDEAARWAAAGAPEGAVVVADHQTRGRGRRGRSWASRPGRSVQLSVVLRPRLAPEGLGLLTAALGVAVCEAVEETAALAARLKWPNDVTVGGRKLAGILVETRHAPGATPLAIAGVGVNVSWTCEELAAAAGEGATSIACELARAGRGGAPARAEVAAAVLARAEEEVSLLARPDGRAEVVTRAQGRSAVVGRRVAVRLPDGRLLEGRALGLRPSGALELDLVDRTVSLDAGEIETVRAAPPEGHPAP